jgi:replicative DNA helicase
MTTALAPFIEDDRDDKELDTAPHNLDAEQAFLGALLYDNEMYHRVADWLKPGHFYDPVHGRIFETAADLIGRGSLADAVVLKTHFDRDDGLREIGGTTYLAVLMEGAVTGNAAVEYAKIIYELALRRELIRIGNDLANAAGADDEADSSDIIEETERSLEALISSRSRDTVGTIHDSAATIVHDLESGANARVIPTGIGDLDKKLGGGLRPSKFIIIAGRPGMAKTVLGLACQKGCSDAGYYSPFFQFEMDAEEMAERALAMVCAQDTQLASIDHPTYEDISQWRAGIARPNKDQRAAMHRALKRLAPDSMMPMPVIDATGMTVPYMTAIARRLYRDAERKGLKSGPVFVDYLQLVRAHTRRGDSKTAEVTDISAALKQMARTLKVPVVALAQLSRQVEQRNDKRPVLSDLRESGGIEQDADIVAMLYRGAYYAELTECPKDQEGAMQWQAEVEDRTLEVLIRKHRGGRTGTVKLYADVSRNIVTNRMADLAGGV